MPDVRIGKGDYISLDGDYKPGDQPPTGYNDWHSWAEVQSIAGLEQVTCPNCGKWKSPQELSDQVHEIESFDRRGNVHRERKLICNKCVKAKPPKGPPA